MNKNMIDLCGKVCPYPVVEIIREVSRLKPGEALRCVVDDPLAIKSVPEELEEYDDLKITIREHASAWEIIVERG